MSNVVVRLLAQGSNPVTGEILDQAITAVDGTFMLKAFKPGNYFLYIPASAFEAAGPLEGLLSVTGFGSDNGEDDEKGENGLDEANPAANGLRSCSSIFPTEANLWMVVQRRCRDKATIRTPTVGQAIDFGFRTPPAAPLAGMLRTTLPAPAMSSGLDPESDEPESNDNANSSAQAITFVAWQAAHSLDGQNQPTANPDGDAFANLAEYALGLKPESGVLPRVPFMLTVKYKQVMDTALFIVLQWAVRTSSSSWKVRHHRALRFGHLLAYCLRLPTLRTERRRRDTQRFSLPPSLAVYRLALCAWASVWMQIRTAQQRPL